MKMLQIKFHISNGDALDQLARLQKREENNFRSIDIHTKNRVSRL